MKRNVKLSGLILLGTLVVLAVAVLSLNREASPDQSEANKIVVMQPNTHILQDAGDGAPILVEFLDFECEACGAFYPYIEELKKEFNEKQISYSGIYYFDENKNCLILQSVPKGMVIDPWCNWQHVWFWSRRV